MPISLNLPLKNKINTVHNFITFSIVITYKNDFFNLYSKTFYVLNFQFFCMVKYIAKIRNLQLRLKVWSRREFLVKKNKKNMGRFDPPSKLRLKYTVWLSWGGYRGPKNLLPVPLTSIQSNAQREALPPLLVHIYKGMVLILDGNSLHGAHA